MIVKNVRHHLKLAWQNLVIAARYDVLVERGVTFKYIDSIAFGAHTTVQSGAYIYGSRKGAWVCFGDHVVVAAGAMVLGEGGVIVGDYTHLGPRVVVTSQFGDSTAEMMTATPTVRTERVRIGRGSWIGSGAIIMPGVNLGDRCVVAPGSVVYGRWPDGTKLAGNPARRVRGLETASPSPSTEPASVSPPSAEIAAE
jgi:acetyltransferase-like isoleucine patch superfamily enzyme